MNNLDLSLFKSKALHWANTFDTCCCLDSNSYTDPYGKFDFIIAAGAKQLLNTNIGKANTSLKNTTTGTEKAFEALQSFYDTHQTWMFGLLSYDLKNEDEQLRSGNPDVHQFPDLFFFVPEYLIALKENQITVLLGNADILNEIAQYEVGSSSRPYDQPDIRPRSDQAAYLEKVRELKQHINRGDIYEVTYCQEFFAEQARIDPLHVFEQLNKLSPTPFSGYFKLYDQYILSASPERFLCKRGNTLVSQPIKGTAGRHPDPVSDEQLKMNLSKDLKERAENVMIVDLVRNDLTKSALKGTVKVEELFGIYSFPQVHQMISTISCTLDPEIHFIKAIQNTFPMGSMTGAPKIRAMELIERYESSKRGAYSGAFGYISPDAEFDFNVIIRSILYHQSKQYLSFQVGGAITFASDALAEYEECMVKASAIIQTLSS